MNQKTKKGLNIGVKSFITALAVIFVLMVATYALTLIVPGGQYDRVEDANGNLIIDTTSEFSEVDGEYLSGNGCSHRYSCLEQKVAAR